MKSQFLSTLLIALAVIILAALPAFAQPPDTMWTRTYGENLADEGKSVQQTTDGGFIIAGWTLSFGADDWDALLIKTDNNGDPSWIRTYRYPGSGWDWANCARQTSDGGYILTGETIPFGGGNTANVLLVKTNSNGEMTWSRSIGGNLDEEGKWVELTTDGGYIIVGHTFSYGAGNSDVYLLKTNTEGIEQWHRTFGGGGDDKGRFVQQTSDGGYIIAGLTYSFGNNYQIYLIKTNADGIEQWHRLFGGFQDEYGNCVQQTEDGGYIIAAYSRSFSPNTMPDVYIVKTNAEGIEQWHQVYGGLGEESGDYIQQTADGGYIVASSSTSFGPGGRSFYLLKLAPEGQLLWDKVLGGPANDWCACVEQTTDLGYIAVGWTYSYGAGGSDVWLIRLEGVIPPIEITLIPYNPPLVILPGGGSFSFNLSMENVSTSTQNFDLWSTIQVPGGSQFTVLGPLVVNLDPGVSIHRLRTQAVPANAPAGQYCYRGFVGDHPWTVTDADSFLFSKQGNAGDWLGQDGWVQSGESFPGESASSSGLHPSSFILHPCSPNPFNASTVASFELRVPSHVQLTVWDTAGRLVATLVDGWREAGVHEVAFDGSKLASGIYLAKLEAGEFSAVQKLVLMK